LLNHPSNRKILLRTVRFAITESNGERFKKSIGKLPEPGRLSSTRQSPLVPRIRVDGDRQSDAHDQVDRF
jgi:hypothetical protein